MSDDSPNSLNLGPVKKVKVVRMSKLPMYALLLALSLMVAVLVYSVNFAHNPEEEEAKTRKVDIQEKEKPLLMGEGQGLALQAPKEAVVVPPAIEPIDKGPLIVVERQRVDAVDPRHQEMENLRRMKAQAYLTALSAPLGVKRVDAGGGKSVATKEYAAERQPSTDYKAPVETTYDVEADKDKEGFLHRSESRDSQWIAPNSRTPGQPLELKTGSIIPGVMVTGVNSDLPGNLIAQVSKNVYDTASGRNLLIPQGAKLYGVYDSRVIYGQERVLIAWNRVIFPDGSAFTLGAMPGGDMAGYAGFTDQIDNHYVRIFGSAVLMSLIMGGTAYTMDSLNSSGSSGSSANDNSVSIQDEMVSALAAQLGQATTQMLQKNLNIKPTLEIRPGYQFNIILTKDMVFQEPYRSWRKAS